MILNIIIVIGMLVFTFLLLSAVAFLCYMAWESDVFLWNKLCNKYIKLVLFESNQE